MNAGGRKFSIEICVDSLLILFSVVLQPHEQKGKESIEQRTRTKMFRSMLSVPLGIGTMMWGNSPLDPYISGKILSDDVLREIVDTAVAGGVTFFDTAEGYGGGTSEVQLAKALELAHLDSRVLVLATKFLPTLWRWTEQAFIDALDASNRRLGIDCCPVYFIHSPIHPLPLEVWIRAAAAAVRLGKMKHLGLSNFNADQVRRALTEAAKQGNVVKIVANQIMCNLVVSNSQELQRTLQVCSENSITVIAYSPIGQGLLCDELTDDKAQKTRLLRMTKITISDLHNVRSVLQAVASQRGKKMSQIALNYLICKGCVPLVGARKAEHVKEALGAIGWSLTHDEVARLDAVALAKHTFEKPRWRRSIFITFISLLMSAYRLSMFLRECKSSVSRLWSILRFH